MELIVTPYMLVVDSILILYMVVVKLFVPS
jgi:hypothetical protein